MRRDTIGPRRLQPAKTESNPVFVLVNEDPHRVIKSFIVPGVTEGQMNGVLPKIPSTRSGLYVDLEKSVVDKGLPRYLQEVGIFAKHPYGSKRAGAAWSGEKAAKTKQTDPMLHQANINIGKQKKEESLSPEVLSAPQTGRQSTHSGNAMRGFGPLAGKHGFPSESNKAIVDKAYPLGEGPKETEGGAKIWLQKPNPEKKTEKKKIDLGTAPSKTHEWWSPAKKAIKDQQGLTEPIYPGDPSAAGAYYSWRHSPEHAPKIEAAKHHIMIDHLINRLKKTSSSPEVMAHQTALRELTKQGHHPKQEHMRAALNEMPPGMSKLMRSLNIDVNKSGDKEKIGKEAINHARMIADLHEKNGNSEAANHIRSNIDLVQARSFHPKYVKRMNQVVSHYTSKLGKALRPEEKKEGKEHWEISGYGEHEVLHPFPGSESGYEGSAKDYFKKEAMKPDSGIKITRRPQIHGKINPR